LPAYTMDMAESFTDDELSDAAETANALAPTVTIKLTQRVERSLPEIVKLSGRTNCHVFNVRLLRFAKGAEE